MYASHPMSDSATNSAEASSSSTAASAHSSSLSSSSSTTPQSDVTWMQYESECKSKQIIDLHGINFEQVTPFLNLNQFQRDHLSKTVPTAPFRLYRSGIEIVEKNLCVSCWLLKSSCMCESLLAFDCRHRVFMLMHHKEFGRGSNTGKLAVRAAHRSQQNPTSTPSELAGISSPSSSLSSSEFSLSGNSAIVQYDLPIQLQALIDLCNREPLNTVVLFPSEESLSIDEFAAKRGWSLPPPLLDEVYATHGTDATVTSSSIASSSSVPSTSSSSLPICPPLNIILLDGTWREARRMRYSLPEHIPAIRIDPFKYRLDGTLRKVATPAGEAEVAPESSASPEIPDVSTLSVSGTSDANAVSEGKSDESPAPLSKRNKKGDRTTKISPYDPAHLNGKVAPPSSSDSEKTYVSLFYPLRKQSQPDRISTIEALVILLKDLSEPLRVTHYLLDLLRILVDSMRVQSGMNCVYDTFTKEQCKRMRVEAAVTAVSLASSSTPKDEASDAVKAVAQPGTVIVRSNGKVFVVGGSGTEEHETTDSIGGRVTRKQRSQRATALRPCLQWNRGLDKCTHTPCRFAHICMLCNQSHQALVCTVNSNSEAQQALVDRLMNRSQSAGTSNQHPSEERTHVSESP